MAVASMEQDAGKATRKRSTATHKPTARSRIGNGKALMVGIDQRSLAYREYQDAVADLVDHVGGNPTPAQFDIIEEAADLKVNLRASRKRSAI